MQTVIGVFEHNRDADDVVTTLHQQQVAPRHIRVVAREEVLQDALVGQGNATLQNIRAGVVSGTIIGLLFGILISLEIVVVPGIQLVVTMGTLMTVVQVAAISVGCGAVIGCIAGIVVRLLRPPQNVHFLNEGIRRGILVIVQVRDQQLIEVMQTIHAASGARQLDDLTPRTIRSLEARGWHLETRELQRDKMVN
ncbi:MAG: hypothetical protein GFH27_549347n101 [Chloroflexi bacterium AL-W]|nr:hypothetical protein [Chloroflexi bacterium AL-N5]NOK85424.1 hypothetical protein [Chloroflexi bacterium AL-W]